MNIFRNLEIDENQYKIIPIEWGCTRYHTITFEGWNVVKLSDDNQLNDVGTLACNIVTNFIDMYKDKYAFTQPIFSYIPAPINVFKLKIGMLELEKYDYLKKWEK